MPTHSHKNRCSPKTRTEVFLRSDTWPLADSSCWFAGFGTSRWIRWISRSWARPWKVTASESGWKELGRPGRGWKSKYYSGGWGRGREQMIGLRISVFFGIPGDLWGFFGIPWDFFGIPWISLFPFLPQCGSCCADKENLLMVRLQSRFAEEPL